MHKNLKLDKLHFTIWLSIFGQILFMKITFIDILCFHCYSVSHILFLFNTKTAAN